MYVGFILNCCTFLGTRGFLGFRDARNFNFIYDIRGVVSSQLLEGLDVPSHRSRSGLGRGGGVGVPVDTSLVELQVSKTILAIFPDYHD